MNPFIADSATFRNSLGFSRESGHMQSPASVTPQAKAQMKHSRAYRHKYTLTYLYVRVYGSRISRGFSSACLGPFALQPFLSYFSLFFPTHQRRIIAVSRLSVSEGEKISERIAKTSRKGGKISFACFYSEKKKKRKTCIRTRALL